MNGLVRVAEMLLMSPLICTKYGGYEKARKSGKPLPMQDLPVPNCCHGKNGRRKMSTALMKNFLPGLRAQCAAEDCPRSAVGACLLHIY